MRQISYLERTPLIGPEGDPEGWESLPEIKVRGTAFHSRSVEISCIVSRSITLRIPALTMYMVDSYLLRGQYVTLRYPIHPRVSPETRL